jgi:putative flippase GtrA
MVKTKKRHSLFMFLRAQLSAQFATLADFILTYVCFQWLGIYYVIATSIGAITGGIVNCVINYKWAFATKDCQFKWVFFKYILVWVGSFLLNVGGVYLLVELLKHHTYLWERASGFYLIIAKIIVSVLVSVGWNYVLHRYFVFQDAQILTRIKSIFKKN